MDDVFTFSASGIATSRGCLRKAAYRYVLNVDTPSNASAVLGSKIHKEMEDWFLEKRVPALAPTKRLLPLAPNPTHPDVLVEHPFRILLPVGVARGFVDLLVPRPVLRLMPDGDWSENRPAVLDWKSTSNLVYAKSETDLLKDPQAILYGVAARLAVAKRVSDVPEVDLQWTYTSTKAAESRAVKLRQTLTILEDGLAEVIATAEKMASAFAEATPLGSVDEVEYDLRECDRYGGCPHKAYCVANQCFVSTGSGPPLVGEVVATTVAPIQTTERKLNMADSSILARLRAGAKTPPKVAPPDLESIPVTETPTTEAEVVKPSPEPGLPVVDVSGLDVPLPPGSAPINSPEAAPNVSPDDPPAPAVAVPTAKARKGKAVRADGISQSQDGVGDLRTTLVFNVQKAVAEGDYVLAEKLVSVLATL